MFGSRRLAKRSIVGTRVAALWQDGRFYPGFIQAQTSDAGSPADSLYTVRFDDGHMREVRALDIVGPGFQTVTSSKLKRGQKVFITLNGRETTGLVTGQAFDEVTVSVKAATGEEADISRRPDEIRLMESRKSARLLDQDTDYSLMADLQITEPKKRTVSHVIDVPSKHMERLGGRNREDSPDSDEEMDTVGDLGQRTEAAMVLTSFNDSQTLSPGTHTRGSEYGRLVSGDSGLSSSVASSGFCSGLSEGGPSPPAAPMDDGIDLGGEVDKWHDGSPREVEDDLMKKCLFKSHNGRCCGQLFRTEREAIAHLSLAHFNGNEVPQKELDFYIDDVPEEVGGVTHAFAQMTTASSPPSSVSTFPNGGSPLPLAFDHDYQRKERVQPPVLMASSVPVGSCMALPSPSCPIPISVPEGHITRSLSWQPSTSPSALHPLGLSPVRSSPSVQERLHLHQAMSPKSHLASPPKSVMASRKPRSEGSAKCRKVFGTDKKDQWCTQCRWKKACSRFT